MHRHSFVFGFEDSAVEFLKALAHFATPFGKTYALQPQPEIPALKTTGVYRQPS